MLVHIKEIIKKAEASKYAVGAFNVNNLEIVQAVISAAEKMNSPVIIQTTEGAIEYAGLEELAALIKAAAKEAKVPVALHLDHGHDFELIKKAIDLGYSSVMIDASDKPFNENIKQVKKVVRYAHMRKVWVQAELGQLAGAEDWIKVSEAMELFTDPTEARRFVILTKIDTFAPAVGNYHGVAKIVKKKKLKLNLKLLEKIDNMVSVPLVLHGASGFPVKEIKGAIKAGIRIINIDSELRVSFVKAEKKFLAANKSEFDPRKVLAPAIQEMKRTVEKKIIMFGSQNKV